MLANLAMPLQSLIDTVVGNMNAAANLAGMGLVQLLSLLLVGFNFLQYASSGYRLRLWVSSVPVPVRQLRIQLIMAQVTAQAQSK